MLIESPFLRLYVYFRGEKSLTENFWFQETGQTAVGEKELWQVLLLLVNIRKWKISKATNRRDRGLCG